MKNEKLQLGSLSSWFSPEYMECRGRACTGRTESYWIVLQLKCFLWYLLLNKGGGWVGFFKQRLNRISEFKLSIEMMLTNNNNGLSTCKGIPFVPRDTLIDVNLFFGVFILPSSPGISLIWSTFRWASCAKKDFVAGKGLILISVRRNVNSEGLTGRRLSGKTFIVSTKDKKFKNEMTGDPNWRQNSCRNVLS